MLDFGRFLFGFLEFLLEFIIFAVVWETEVRNRSEEVEVPDFVEEALKRDIFLLPEVDFDGLSQSQNPPLLPRHPHRTRVRDAPRPFSPVLVALARDLNAPRITQPRPLLAHRVRRVGPLR